MNQQTPVVYLLHGEDEFALQETINKKLKPLMGEASNAEMDITTLDGRHISRRDLQAETHTTPFISQRRMVILTHPLSLASKKKERHDFLKGLESIPPSTACILKVQRDLKQDHWLIQWAKEHPRHVWHKSFSLPRGEAMTRWIQTQARERGGEFTRDAARLLAAYVNEDPRLASQEIEKLLTYVNQQRPVSQEDVRTLTADVRQGDVFEMVDAISRGDGETAMRMLRRQLQENHPLALFGMIVRQFRLLIQVRELLDHNPQRDHYSIADELDVHPYPIQKILPQAKLFTLSQLEGVYHKLSDVDLAMKTGQLDQELALDLLIASLTQ